MYAAEEELVQNVVKCMPNFSFEDELRYMSI